MHLPKQRLYNSETFEIKNQNGLNQKTIKKRTLNKVLLSGVLFFGIAVLLWNCEKVEFQPTIVVKETASNDHLKIIALDDIYDVVAFPKNVAFPFLGHFKI